MFNQIQPFRRPDSTLNGPGSFHVRLYEEQWSPDGRPTAEH